MSSFLSNQEVNRIKMLMVLATFRGMYGSGAAIVHQGKKKTLGISIAKTELCAAELITEPDFSAALNKQPKIIMAHARAPTKGDNSIENAHPHRWQHITGVHNGTMWNVMGETISDKQSDSAAIFKAIAEHGVEAFMKGSRGAYSLVWIDTKDGSLNFLRNDQRPMVFACQKMGDRVGTMYWSSEMGMLKFMLARDKVDEAVVTFESPKAYQHVRYPLNVQGDITPIEVKQYADPTVTRPYSERNWRGWESMYDEYDDTGEAETLDDRLMRQRREREASARREMERRQAAQRRLPAIIDARRLPHSSLPAPTFLPRADDIIGQRRTAPEDTFRPEKEPRAVAQLLRHGPCCICDNTPQVVTLNGEVTYPPVFPVKFGSGWPQYICEDCVSSRNPIAISVLAPARIVN
jgi:predicted glutamine amidotransferase